MLHAAQLPVTGVGVVALGVLLGPTAMVVGAVVLLTVAFITISLALQEDAAAAPAPRPGPGRHRRAPRRRVLTAYVVRDALS